MNGISGITSSMYLAAGSMDTHSIGIQVSAHNVANISTDGFTPQRATYATRTDGQGVELESVHKPDIQDMVNLSDSASIYADVLQQSGTELAREMPHMLLTERGFQANAATIRAADEMLGSLVNSVA